jgi:hypothetical protein
MTAAARGVMRIRPLHPRAERIRGGVRQVRANFVEAGRHLGAIFDEIGEDSFREWVPENTGLVADEAKFLIEWARVVDADGDEAALFASDGAPKEFHLPPMSIEEARELAERLKVEADDERT